MGEFLQSEKRLQAAWKLKTKDLTESAKVDGSFKGRPLRFFIQNNQSSQNLFDGIREEAIRYFKNHKIAWHDNEGDYPSPHLCDSQVACVNFLMPLTQSEEVILGLFKRYFPEIKRIIPMEEDSAISFEWIGEKNYLKERIIRGEVRRRGAYCTSADGAIMFETESGKRIIVLIEWKYTESYDSTSYKYSESGTDRTTIYQHLWDKMDCPIDKRKLNKFEDLFYEPFYQFTRQQFLAKEMEHANELGADEVYVMHLSPKANNDFKLITSPSLKTNVNSATEVWKNLLKDDSRFIPLYIEDFFDRTIILKDNKLFPYWNYLSERYSSIVKN